MIHDLLFAPNNYFQGFLFFHFLTNSHSVFFLGGGSLRGKMEDENCMEWPTGTRICKEFDGEAYEGKVEKIHRRRILEKETAMKQCCITS